MTHYREIPEDRILKFPSTAGFKGWKPFFSDESTSHPAKMNLKLLQWILSNYTKPSDTVLDPMAGTGSTIVLASMMGRDSLAVEFEPKFCEMIKNNIARAEKQSSLINKGSMKCYQGDARELSKLLGESDVIITSPPYSSIEVSPQGAGDKDQNWNLSYRKAKKTGNWDEFKEQMKKQKKEQGYSMADAIVSSPPYGNRLSDVAIHDDDSARMGYRQTIDVVLTSPPYEATGLDGGDTEKRTERLERAGYNPKDYLGGRARNTVLKPYDEVDAIVSSPPYGSDNANLQSRKDKSAQSVLASTGVRGIELDPENLGNLEYGDIDAIVTSPPYSEGLGHMVKNPSKVSIEKKQSAMGQKSDTGYGITEDNIGNLKSDNYLEAMLQVYRESYKVLKPKGIMVLVTKNFIREKKVVRLDLDTIKLCENAGFKLIDRWYFKLPIKSFWKILYAKKYPDVPEIEYEDILVFERTFDIKGEIS